jgi:putative transposon-encoded protein
VRQKPEFASTNVPYYDLFFTKALRQKMKVIKVSFFHVLNNIDVSMKGKLTTFGIGTKTDGAPEEYMTYGHNQAAPSSSYLHTQLHITRALAL